MAEGPTEEIRPRTHSFDLHLLMRRTKIMKISKLFRSRSDSNVKQSPRTSPSVSPHGSPSAPPRRRFMRVIRDDQSSGEEYENPHVIRKYTQEYAETLQGLRKSKSMDEPRSLPYTITGVEHTILKKFSSFDSPTVSTTATPDHSPPSSKHASFSGEVEIIEYDKKDKIQKHRFQAHRERISFDEGGEDVCSLDDELGLAQCALEERDEYDAGDEADSELDRIPSSELSSDPEDVFQFEEDEAGADSKKEDVIVGSPSLSRQLSSDSDSSDSDRPSRKKKSKIEDLRDTAEDVESRKQAGSTEGRRKVEVES